MTVRADLGTPIRVARSHLTRLADGRLVALSYPDYESGAGRFHGPVSVAIMNHSGRREATLTVAPSGGRTTAALSTHVDEAEHDPIEALALGTVARLSTSVLDDGGQREVESRT